MHIQSLKKYEFFKKLDKQRQSLSPNTNNFLAFFIVNCRYLVKTTLIADLIFYKLKFFESLIIFLEPTIKLITGIFDLQK